jgi:hypothetical protein
MKKYYYARQEFLDGFGSESNHPMDKKELVSLAHDWKISVAKIMNMVEEAPKGTACTMGPDGYEVVK